MASRNGTKMRIDNSGRIVVPKGLRQRLGLKPGTELEALDQPDGLLLRAVEGRGSMVRVDGLWLHRGEADANANWNRLIDEAREERIEAILKA